MINDNIFKIIKLVRNVDKTGDLRKEAAEAGWLHFCTNQTISRQDILANFGTHSIHYDS